MVRIALAAITVVFVMVACGKLSPLTSDQKQRFSETLTDLARSMSAPSQASSNVNKTKSKKAKSISSLTSLSSLIQTIPGHTLGLQNSTALDSTDKSYGEMSKRLQEALERGDCKEVNETPSKIRVRTAAGNTVEIPKAKFTISGDKCPIEISVAFELNSDGKGNKLAGSFNLDYSVKDDEFRKLNDIDVVKLNAPFSLNLEETDSTIKADMQLNLGGTIHSQKHGDITPYVEVKGEGVSGKDPNSSKGSLEAKFGLRYPDFTAELKFTGNQVSGQKEELKYFINNEEVSRKEFEDYIKKLEINFSSSSSHKIDLNK